MAELRRKGKLPDGVGCADVFNEIAKTPLEDWIDNQDVMNTLHISQRTLQALRSNGTIKFSKFGKDLLPTTRHTKHSGRELHHVRHKK